MHFSGIAIAVQKKPASNQISRLAANHHTENCHKSLDESEEKNDNEQEHNSKYYMYFCNKFE